MTELLHVTVDRFEGEMAVLITFVGEVLDVLRARLPRRLREGDYIVLTIEDGQILSAKIDHEATAEVRKRITAKLERLRRGAHLDATDPDAKTD